MGRDSFTEVTTRSWGNRVGSSFAGILFGLLLCIAGPGLLWWNEGRAVGTARSLAEGASAVVSVPASSPQPGNDGRLIHTSGEVSARGEVRDPLFALAAPVIALRRNVEMYQWHEEKESKSKKKVGGSEETVTTYRYERRWSSRAIDSSDFREPSGHQNPGRLPFDNETFYAPDVRLGDFRLPAEMVRKIDAFSPLPVGRDIALAAAGRRAQIAEHDRYVYVGEDPARPSVGDLRVSFSVINPLVASIVARQAGGSFAPYATRAGREIALLEVGHLAADAMFTRAQRRNTLLTWALRIGGFLLLTFGLSLIAAPLAVIGDVLPIVGRILRGGIGMVALLLAATISLIVIAAAWVFYRPVLGGALLACAVVAIVLLVRRRSPAMPPPLPPAA